MRPARVLVLMPLLLAASIAAQEAPPAPAPAPQPAAPAAAPEPAYKGIEEIIITSERREQNIQDVAQTVTAFTPADLEAANIEDAYDLQLKVPGFVATGGLAAVTLRGLGQDTDVLGPGIDPGFQVHINDIYLAQIAIGLAGFVDLEGIEVLAGPQGTGFGRNSTGGSMNMRTARPGLEDWEASGTFGFSQWSNYKIETMLNAPIVKDKLGFRIAYRREIPSDYYDVTGKNGHKQHLSNNVLSGGHYVRTSLRWAPTDTLTSDFIFAYSFDDENGGTPRPLGAYPAFEPGQSTIFATGVNPTGATPNSSDASEVRSDLGQSQVYKTYWGQAIVEWEVASHVLKLNGNYQYWDYALDRDQDYTDNLSGRLVLLDRHKTWSGEATIRSEYEDLPFDWLFGANYQLDNAPNTHVPFWNYDANTELQNFAVFDAFAPAATLFSPYTADAQLVCGGPCLFTQGDVDRPFLLAESDVETRSTGVFLQGGVNFNDDMFRIDGGVRWSQTYRNMKDTGYWDILTEPYDIVTDGFCSAFAGVPGLGFLADPFFLSKENCFNFFVAPGILQAYLPPGSPTLNAGNVAFLIPLKGDRDQATFNATTVVKENTWRSWTGRMRFEVRPTDGQLFYAGYSRGVRHGGYDFFDTDGFESETINAYEIGAKNTLLDGRLFLNTTFFFYDFKNRFISSVVNNIGTTVNAPLAQLYGIELQWTFAPIDNLLISGNAGWLHTEITGDFLSQDNSVSPSNPTNYCPNKVYPNTPGSFFAGLPAVGDRHGSGPTCDGGVLQNLKGNVLPRAPEFTISAGVEYAFEMGSGTLTPRLDFAYRDSIFFNQYEDSGSAQGAYTKTDIRLRYGFSAQPVWFELFVQNLEDNQKVKTQHEGNGNWVDYYWLAAPRTFGVRLGFKFSGATAGELWPF